MAWRVHLTNQAIQSLYILSGKKPVLAAWTKRDHVVYYDIESGATLGEQTVQSPPAVKRSSEEWQEYLGTLTGIKDKSFLPVVQTALSTIHSTSDGKMRLYHLDDTQLILEEDGKEAKLEVKDTDRFLNIELDRTLGLIAGLDESGKLHIYQQNIRIGAFDLGLKIKPELNPSVTVSQGGRMIYVTDGRTIILTDTSGKILKQLDTHYYIGKISCSPGGGMLVTSELDAGVIRVYRGDDLVLTHQRHAIDLMVNATQTQLLAELPPEAVALSALVAHSKGTFAFAMSGVICVTDTTEMNELPRPQALL